jgi:hypothetical protein
MRIRSGRSYQKSEVSSPDTFHTAYTSKDVLWKRDVDAFVKLVATAELKKTEG